MNGLLQLPCNIFLHLIIPVMFILHPSKENSVVAIQIFCTPIKFVYIPYSIL